MNKKLISLAVAAALSAPLAVNAAPTLFGHLQVEIADFDRDGSNDTLEARDESRGRLGVFGDEDLGGGLKGIYRFEWKVDTTDATQASGSREAYVGLKGGWGEVTMGSNKSAYKYYGGVSYDPLVATVLEARSNNGGMFGAITGSTAVNTYGAHGFLDNSVRYQGDFGPAQFMFTYVLTESATEDDNYVAGLKFKIGSAAEVFVAHANVASGVAATDSSNTKFGGQVKFGNHTISAQIEDHSDDVANLDADAFFLGWQFKFSPTGAVVAQLGEIDSDTASADREYMAVAYIHNFSANTRGTFGYRTTDADGTTNDVDVLAFGLRIMF